MSIVNEFNEVFGTRENSVSFLSPGRINLIGEHTDYNDGYVFPSAISSGTYGVVSLREDSLIRVYSANFSEDGIIELDLNDLKRHDLQWPNYIIGMVTFLKEEGHQIDKGWDFYIKGTIPNGAGLSSSASLEILVATVVKELFSLDVSDLELIRLGKKVENEFIGVNSGIMDQFGIVKGRKNKAVLLNCQTLEFEHVTVDLKEHQIVIMNTNKKRQLSDSDYNSRQKESAEAFEILKRERGISSMSEVTLEMLLTLEDTLGEVLFKRVRHIVTESARTLLSYQALNKGDLDGFGELLNQSHRSLRDDYEVSCLELDTLVETAWEQTGVLGARMMGAGFGGCSMAIVSAKEVPAFIEAVGAKYKEVIGYEADFYIETIGDGPRVLD